MRSNKRLISLLLAFVMIFSAFAAVIQPISAFAAEQIADTGTGTGYDSADDVVYKRETENGSTYLLNWGAQGELCVFLSSYAEDFYSGDYIYSDMSQSVGGSNEISAASSQLYSELSSLMSSKHTHQTTYDDTREQYKYTDCEKNDSSQIYLFYCGARYAGVWESGNTWNREHVWPKSKCITSSNAKYDSADIMILRPAHKGENSSRNNKAYGATTTSSYFYPGDAVKGDCARVLLYYATRWGKMEYMFGAEGVIESLDLLLQWMEEDPVDTWEMGRNDAVQAITGTRNVFVDYPEYAWLLFNRDIPENYQTPSQNDVNDGGETVSGTSAPSETESEKSTEPVIPDTDGERYTYTFSSYPAGTQYAKNESHVLDDKLTVITNDGHFTTQIRLYKSTAHSATATFVSSQKIESISLNAGENADILKVWSSADGEDWELADEISVTSSYSDYNVASLGDDCRYIKLEPTSKQIRIASISVKYAAEEDSSSEETTAEETTTEETTVEETTVEETTVEETTVEETTVEETTVEETTVEETTVEETTVEETTAEETTTEETTVEETTTEETTQPEEDTVEQPVKYTFSDYTAGKQYAKNEVHALDGILSVTTDDAHFTTQIRLYQSSAHKATAVFTSTEIIGSVIINAGYKNDTLKVWSSPDGETWTLSEVAVTSSYNDYKVTSLAVGCKYIKLEATSDQIRIANITMNYLVDAPIPEKESPRIENFCISLNQGVTVKVNYYIPEEWLLLNPDSELVFKNELVEKNIAAVSGTNMYMFDLTPGAINNDLILEIRLADGSVVDSNNVSVEKYVSKVISSFASGELNISQKKYDVLMVLLDAIDAYAAAADGTLSEIEESFDDVSESAHLDKSKFTGIGASLGERVSIKLGVANLEKEDRITVKLGDKELITDGAVEKYVNESGHMVIDGLFPTDFNDVISVSISNGAEVSATASFTVNSYFKALYGASASQDALKCMIASTYRYGVATEAYLIAE